MTYVEISEKSLIIAAEAAGSKLHHYERMAEDNKLGASIEAHARTLDAFKAYKQDVSDAVEAYLSHSRPWPDTSLRRFIIPKPDPLVEALNEMGFGWSKTASEEFRAAIEARGGRIVWEGE